MSERDDKERAVQVAANTNPARGPIPDLEKMFKEHHKRVFQSAYRITGNAQDAEDAMQTVFLRLARREGGTPLSDSPGNYLQRAAINAALDVVRSRKSARATALEDVEPVLADDGADSPSEEHERKELRRHVRQALTKVSDKAAEIFVLRYFEGYGNHEIAKMLGTSRSTVNVILHRTRNRIKEDIRSALGEES
jgi:RNA polymerase sigma-70 factor (ECF subfamily)